MPIIQKVIKVGDSKGITLPKSWLEYYERQTGQVLSEVTVEINNKLIIRPLFQGDNSNASK